jgi:hypothetical protein
MKYLTAVFAAGLCLATSAALADDPMADTYANTVTTKNVKTGQTGMLFFNSDGTYNAKATTPDGKAVEYPGKWLVKDDGKTICLTPTLPPDAPNPAVTTCSPLVGHHVGDSWNVTNDRGDTFAVSMTAGR